MVEPPMVLPNDQNILSIFKFVLSIRFKLRLFSEIIYGVDMPNREENPQNYKLCIPAKFVRK